MIQESSLQFLCFAQSSLRLEEIIQLPTVAAQSFFHVWFQPNKRSFDLPPPCASSP
jgi:hypothetical protein